MVVDDAVLDFGHVGFIGRVRGVDWEDGGELTDIPPYCTSRR